MRDLLSIGLSDSWISAEDTTL